MYRHSPESIADIERLTAAGKSVRQIRDELKIAKNTVAKYRDAYLAKHEVFCECGKPVKHQGWCWYRFGSSPERRTFMEKWRDRYHANKERFDEVMSFSRSWSKNPCHPHNLCWIEQRRKCVICNNYRFIEHAGTEAQDYWTCRSEWCERIYTFYYVEGRSRPPSVRGGRKNGLRFEFFLSDYIRRVANEQARTQHRRTSGCPL